MAGHINTTGIVYEFQKKITFSFRIIERKKSSVIVGFIGLHMQLKIYLQELP